MAGGDDVRYGYCAKTDCLSALNVGVLLDRRLGKLCLMDFMCGLCGNEILISTTFFDKVNLVAKTNLSIPSIQRESEKLQLRHLRDQKPFFSHLTFHKGYNCIKPF